MGLVAGPHARTPRTHSQWVAVPGRTPPRTDGQGRESARPRTPHTQARGAPPGRPRAAPTARKASTQKQACTQGGARPQARQGDEGTGPPPQELNRWSTGPRQETWRGTNRLERPYRRPAPEPRVVRAPHRPGGGGGAYAAGARAHTHATDTRRRPEGQPDRARGTHRRHRMAYRQAKGRDTRLGQPATRTRRGARAGRSPRGDARTGISADAPGQPRVPRTHDQGTAPAKAVVAHSATHQPHG